MRTRLVRGALSAGAACLIAAAPRGAETPSGAPAPLRVRVPAAVLPYPEPLAPGRRGPGFRFRGIKGWDWTPRQYLEEIPYLARFRMNFLMNCYLSLYTPLPGGALRNEWWKPMTDAARRDYARVIAACRRQEITFCFAVNPQLDSPRPLDPGSPGDVESLLRHYAWAQGEGVRWFSVCLDDVGFGPGGAAAGGAEHARLANTVLARLRAADPGAQLILCPVAYWGDGSEPASRAYLEALGRLMHPDVYVFWTGDSVYARRITRGAAEAYRRAVGHRLFLWDNYPVNDGNPTLNLGPVNGRDPGLCEVAEGYMANPMDPQNEINRIPMATSADYAYNPWAYDPDRSVSQAIAHLSGSAARQRALGGLVEAYPGFIALGGGSGANPVRERFEALLSSPGSRGAAAAWMGAIQGLEARLEREFPGEYGDAKATVGGDIEWMSRRLGGGR